MNSLHRVSRIAIIVFGFSSLIYAVLSGLAIWLPASQTASYANIIFLVLEVAGWVFKVCIAVMLFNFILSTMIVPSEGVRFMKFLELEHAKVAAAEREQQVNDYMSSLPPGRLLYMRIFGASVLLLALGLATVGR